MVAHAKISLMLLLRLSCFASLPCHVGEFQFLVENLSRLRFIRHNSTPSMQLSIAAHFFIVCKSHRPCPKGFVHNPYLRRIFITLNMRSLCNRWNATLQELLRRNCATTTTPINIFYSLSLVVFASPPQCPHYDPLYSLHQQLHLGTIFIHHVFDDNRTSISAFSPISAHPRFAQAPSLCHARSCWRTLAFFMSKLWSYPSAPSGLG
jgi:hypothetical protein